jgi:hypothetical protein
VPLGIPAGAGAAQLGLPHLEQHRRGLQHGRLPARRQVERGVEVQQALALQVLHLALHAALNLHQVRLYLRSARPSRRGSAGGAAPRRVRHACGWGGSPRTPPPPWSAGEIELPRCSSARLCCAGSSLLCNRVVAQVQRCGWRLGDRYEGATMGYQTRGLDPTLGCGGNARRKHMSKSASASGDLLAMHAV